MKLVSLEGEEGIEGKEGYLRVQMATIKIGSLDPSWYNYINPLSQDPIKFDALWVGKFNH